LGEKENKIRKWEERSVRTVTSEGKKKGTIGKGLDGGFGIRTPS